MLGIVLYVTGTALLVANLAATAAAGRDSLDAAHRPPTQGAGERARIDLDFNVGLIDSRYQRDQAKT